MESKKQSTKQLQFGEIREYFITEKFTFSKCYKGIHYVSETSFRGICVSSLAVLTEGTILFMSNMNMVHVPKITHYMLKQTGTQKLFHIFFTFLLVTDKFEFCFLTLNFRVQQCTHFYGEVFDPLGLESCAG